MHRIYPITEEACKPFWGRPVMVVMNDGTRHIGTLSGIVKNQLILNDESGNPYSLSYPADHKTGKSSKRAKLNAKAGGKNKKTKSGEATVSAYSPGPVFEDGAYGPQRWQGYGYRPFPYFGERLALDLAAIALLFLIFI
ncbi:hypothetical protein [Paenibacillus senegalensis]|uniref:hypothetical protein n=1 Tax=Paenibacillus senegalensis TaxID=1465766 RepID=UPI000289C393|nr:hypothetical protein [Paenibacillus senegalensis]